MSSVAGIDPQDLEETVRACLWLHGIALAAETLQTVPEGSALWLEKLGLQCAAELQRLGLYPVGGVH